MTLDHSYFEEMEAKIPHGKVRTRFRRRLVAYVLSDEDTGGN